MDWHGVLPSGPYGYPLPHLPHFYTLDGDAATGFDVALYKYFSNSLRGGRLPFWNPYQHLGLDYLGEGGTLVLYPFNLLHLVLPATFWDLPQFLQFFCAQLGLYLLAKEYGFSRWQAIVCGTCALAAGYLQGFMFVTTLLSGFVWMPYILLSIERVVNTDSIGPALLPGAAATFLLGTSCNAGLGVIIIFCALLYAVARAGLARKWTALLKTAVPFGIGGLLSAPVLIPFFLNLWQFHKALASKAGEHVLNLRQLPGVFLPYVYSPMNIAGAFGQPDALSPSYWVGWIPPPLGFLALAGAVLAIKGKHRQMSILTGIGCWLWLWLLAVEPFNAVSLIPVVSRLSTGYLMAPIQLIVCLLAGYAVTCLGVAGFPWKLILGAWTAFVGGLLLIAAWVYVTTTKPDIYWVLGSSVPAVLWAVIPPIALWRGARMGIEKRNRAIPLLALAAVIASAVAYFPSGADVGITFWLRVIPLAVFLLIAAGLLVASQRSRFRSGWAWTTVILTFLAVNIVDVLQFPAWPTRYDPFTAPPFVRYLEQNAANWRTYMTDLFVFPNFSSAFGIPSVNVLGVLLPYEGSVFFQRFLNPYEPPTQIYGFAGRMPGAPMISPIEMVVTNKNFWDYIGVRYFVTSMQGPPLNPALFELALRDPPALVWRNNSAQKMIYVAPESLRVADWREGQDRFATASDLRRTAYIEGSSCPSNAEFPSATEPAQLSDMRIEPNRVNASLVAQTGGTLVLVSNYAKGWSVRINGAPARIFRINGTFLGACLPAPGSYQIVFEFEPQLWIPSLFCAAAGLILFVLFAHKHRGLSPR